MFFFGFNSDKNEFFHLLKKKKKKKNMGELININSSDMNIYEKQNLCYISN